MPESAKGGKQPADHVSTFEREAAADSGLLAEFRDFLLHNKKWWLTPVILVLLLLGVVLFLSQTALAPFIYPLF